MVSSIASSPSIDLSGLPAPDIIAQPDFETRFAAKLARFQTEYPDFDASVESDPAVKLLQSDAYDELVLAAAFNDAARGMLLAFASGARLDHLGALFGVARLTVTPANVQTGAAAVLESDDAFRRRIQLAPHSFSVAGPEGAYLFHALSAHGDVADASVVSPAPTEIVVTLLSHSGDGIPSAPVLSAVDLALQGPVRPMCDFVTVQPVELIDFAITAEMFVFAGPDAGLILGTAQDSLAAFLAKARRLGRDVPVSALIAALHVANVQRVNLIEPAADVVISPAQIAVPSTIAVTVAGSEL